MLKKLWHKLYKISYTVNIRRNRKKIILHKVKFYSSVTLFINKLDKN